MGGEAPRDRRRGGACRSAAGRHGSAQPGSSAAVLAVSDLWRCLPGNTLIELELGCGLQDGVPVRQPFEQIIPGGRSAGGGDWSWLGGLPDMGKSSVLGSCLAMSKREST
jgi:hypothetical protein